MVSSLVVDHFEADPSALSGVNDPGCTADMLPVPARTPVAPGKSGSYDERDEALQIQGRVGKMAAVNAVVSPTGVTGSSGVGMPFPNPNALIQLEGIESELLSMGIVPTEEGWAPNGSRPGIARVADKRSWGASPVVSPGVVAKQDATGLSVIGRCQRFDPKERERRFRDGYGHPNAPP